MERVGKKKSNHSPIKSIKKGFVKFLSLFYFSNDAAGRGIIKVGFWVFCAIVFILTLGMVWMWDHYY